MRRQPVEGPMRRWQDWRWVLDAVVDNDPAWGTAPRALADEGEVQRWLHPGFEVELFRDDAEGYLLNRSHRQEVRAQSEAMYKLLMTCLRK